jgi:hypothetical protein
MTLARSGIISWPLFALMIITGTAIAAPAESDAAATTQQAHEAASLLRSIRMDARQVRSHAWDWAMLTKDPSTSWYSYDRQWNQIKPAVEDMSIKLNRLEEMRAELSPWEQTATDRSKPLVTEIAWETHTLRTGLDKFYTDLGNLSVPASFKGESSGLARDAGRLVRTVERAATQATVSPAAMMKHS